MKNLLKEKKQKIWTVKENGIIRPDVVSHVYNPSYARGRDRRIASPGKEI
jgi:hypothetical protein